MSDLLHFDRGERTLCGMAVTPGMKLTEDRAAVLIGIHADTNIGMPAKGACKDCAAALAVTRIAGPAKKVEPPVEPSPLEPMPAPTA